MKSAHNLHTVGVAKKDIHTLLANRKDTIANLAHRKGTLDKIAFLAMHRMQHQTTQSFVILVDMVTKDLKIATNGAWGYPLLTHGLSLLPTK